MVPSLWRLAVASNLTMVIRKRCVDPDFRRAALADLALLDITADQRTDSYAWTDTGPSGYKMKSSSWATLSTIKPTGTRAEIQKLIGMALNSFWKTARCHQQTSSRLSQPPFWMPDKGSQSNAD